MDKSQAEREARVLAEGREKMLEAVMKAENTGKVEGLPYQNYLIRQVLEDLAEDFKRDSKRGNGAGAYRKFATYLGLIDSKIAALRAIQAVLSVLFKAGAADQPQPVYTKAAQVAGKAVYSEYLMRHFKQLNPKIFNSLVREYDKSMTRDEKHLLDAFKAKFEKEGYTLPVWEFGDVQNVGMYIMSRLVAHGFLESWTKTESKGGKANTVRYTALAEHLRSASLEIMAALANAPKVAGAMIEPPLDWSWETNGDGGYHTKEMQILMPYAMQHVGPKPISPMVTQALNILQGRRWKINQEALSVVRAASLVNSFGDVVSPDPGPFPAFPEGGTELDKKKWKGAARKWYTDKKVRAVKHMKAQRTFVEAQELSQYPCIWYPWTADFRTRLYSKSSGVGPQGNDLEKGLLQVAVGKPIDTPEAWFWYKIHGANKWGNDKDTKTDRVKWVDGNHQLILDIGLSPSTRTEWQQADCPVQFLAWCIEYAAIVSGTCTLSYLTLGQDGTCNGLQNFSAMMRDEVGGAAVNLVPSSAPRDIYMDVATRTAGLLTCLPPHKLRDAWLQHGMNRKITKRTTMTLPYGCTRFACSTFITDDYLMSVYPPEIELDDYGEAANYLSHVIWKALDEVVVKAREVMEWLKGWAKHAASNGMQVGWYTPNGQWVVSEYEKMKQVRIKSVAFGTALKLRKPEEGSPDLAKIANAVAPNFVHSLDASHLARVVIRAHAEGMEVVTIHDDFAVHACDTDKFHRIIREEFVNMYLNSDLLGDMAKRTGYTAPPPERGSLDLEVIKNSEYFFC